MDKPDRFHLSYEVDKEIYDIRTAFLRRDPKEVGIYLRTHHLMSWIAVHQKYGEDSCFFLTEDGSPARLRQIRKAQIVIADQVGVSIAEFQKFLKQYYDSDLKRRHKKDFFPRCKIHDRCIRPSHLVLRTKDGRPVL